MASPVTDANKMQQIPTENSAPAPETTAKEEMKRDDEPQEDTEDDPNKDDGASESHQPGMKAATLSQFMLSREPLSLHPEHRHLPPLEVDFSKEETTDLSLIQSTYIESKSMIPSTVTRKKVGKYKYINTAERNVRYSKEHGLMLPKKLRDALPPNLQALYYHKRNYDQ